MSTVSQPGGNSVDTQPTKNPLTLIREGRAKPFKRACRTECIRDSLEAADGVLPGRS
jgi:hypothetical protein